MEIVFILLVVELAVVTKDLVIPSIKVVLVEAVTQHISHPVAVLWVQQLLVVQTLVVVALVTLQTLMVKLVVLV